MKQSSKLVHGMLIDFDLKLIYLFSMKIKKFKNWNLFKFVLINIRQQKLFESECSLLRNWKAKDKKLRELIPAISSAR